MLPNMFFLELLNFLVYMVTVIGYVCPTFVRSIIFDECNMSNCKRMCFVTPKCKRPSARHEFKLFFPVQMLMDTCKAEPVVRVYRSSLRCSGCM